MKKSIKRTFVAILILCLSVVSLAPVSAVAEGNEIMPLFNNVNNAIATASINNSGKITIGYKYIGSPSVTTKAVITTYIDTKYEATYVGSRTHQLPSKGTYRVTVIYKIYGTGGSADEIKRQVTASY